MRNQIPTMNSIIRRSVVLPFLASACVVIAQPADAGERTVVTVPGEGSLVQGWAEAKEGPEINYLRYSGPPEWLIAQKDPNAHWHKIASLRKIEFHFATLRSEEMAYIATLKSVDELDLTFDGNRFVGRALDPLRRMTWLKTLKLDIGSQVFQVENGIRDRERFEYPRGDFFKFLDGLTALETIYLQPECDETTYVRLCNLKNLKSVSLGTFRKAGEKFSKLDDMNAARIANLRKLESLDLAALERATPFLNALRNHDRLQKLFIDRTKLETADVEMLATLKNLKELFVSGERIGALSPLGTLPKLSHLTLSFRDVGQADRCRFLSKLTDLEQLTLIGVKHDDFSLEPLRGHQKLKELSVGQILGDTDIDILATMPALKSVYVSNLDNSAWHIAARRRLLGVTIKGPSQK